ncbi:MAG: hypothetical protein KF819_06180 [Labilithrix sp.]|nr:hypothetical protein [Labilithrix sp.]
MKKLLIAVFVGVPLVGCTEEIIIKKAPGQETGAEGQPAESTDPTDPGSEPTTPGNSDTPAGPTASADRCLDGQDMDAADINVTTCPAIPEIPEGVKVGKTMVGLGAWELGTTADGDTYVYGSLSAPGSGPRILEFDGGTVAVNKENLECWSKGYYRLRKILQDPPAEWVALKDAGFQYRFFQFQTDLRNGPTGFKQISSFQDHLIKWVTVINASGVCQQPTLSKFKAYAKSELTRRGLPVPGGS